jgi:coproporphyrinogen III oxidase-like Fe-S oxidoreductase
MIKISCYKTKQDQLSKAFCHLAQKCYYSSMNTCVITNNSDFTDSILSDLSYNNLISKPVKKVVFTGISRKK